jgi:hypothetical protein
MKVFKLVKEDWSNVGLAMGYQGTSVIWEKLFSSSEDAMEYAEDDHTGAPFEWTQKGKRIHSGDLRSHAYIITKEKVS